LRQFTLANSDHPNHTVQTRALHRYLRWRNANARHPDVLTAQRKERARIRSDNQLCGATLPVAAQSAEDAAVRASARRLAADFTDACATDGLDVRAGFHIEACAGTQVSLPLLLGSCSPETLVWKGAAPHSRRLTASL
jgi:hypothetical protein